jgi:hypothetical protein
MGREPLLQAAVLALARLAGGVPAALDGGGVHRRGDHVEDRQDVQQVLAVPAADDRPVPLDAERGGQGRHHREAGLILAQ